MSAHTLAGRVGPKVLLDGRETGGQQGGTRRNRLGRGAGCGALTASVPYLSHTLLTAACSSAARSLELAHSTAEGKTGMLVPPLEIWASQAGAMAPELHLYEGNLS